jgi:hypothetical protein
MFYILLLVRTFVSKSNFVIIISHFCEQVPACGVFLGSGLERTVAGERAELDIVSKRLNEDTPGEEFSLELRGPVFIEVGYDRNDAAHVTVCNSMLPNNRSPQVLSGFRVFHCLQKYNLHSFVFG